MHSDLKPENILLSTNDKNKIKICICDFGVSHRLKGDGVIYKINGTPGYFAPEMFKK